MWTQFLRSLVRLPKVGYIFIALIDSDGIAIMYANYPPLDYFTCIDGKADDKQSNDEFVK